MLTYLNWEINISDGPEYSPDEEKVNKSIAKMKNKLEIKYKPKIVEIIQKSKNENKAAVKRYFKKAFDEEKEVIIKEKAVGFVNH